MAIELKTRSNMTPQYKDNLGSLYANLLKFILCSFVYLNWRLFYRLRNSFIGQFKCGN